MDEYKPEKPQQPLTVLGVVALAILCATALAIVWMLTQ